ncbi:hypothetical protein ACGF12_30290 [Kitasatospora sp. NPDC048296]|uniref:hypothetical protein n=1 Tax=Kitasatospora sp. NPDC048296 TaxID=3364048 RepID=UPI0037206DC9
MTATTKTFDRPWDLAWLAADAGDLLPVRRDCWGADPASHDSDGNPQAVLKDGRRRVLITRVGEGITVRTRPYTGEPGGDRIPVSTTRIALRHITPATLAADIARSHLASPQEPDAAPERRRLLRLLTMTELIARLPGEAQATGTMLAGVDVVEWRQGPDVTATACSNAPGRILLEAQAPLGSVERALRSALPPHDAELPYSRPGAYRRLAAAFPVLTPYPNVPGTDTLAGLGTGRTVVNVHLADGAPDDDGTRAGLDIEADLDLVLLVLGLL